MNTPNDISMLMDGGKDLSDRWVNLLCEIGNSLQFKSTELIPVRMSQWWRTGKVGAVSLKGIYLPTNQKAILKIQGSKPNISEVEMIQAFELQNESKVIRAPKIYTSLPWNEKLQFEAFVMEEIKGEPIIDQKPVGEVALKMYFELYQEYKDNCLKKPWFDKSHKYSFRQQYQQWRSAVTSQIEEDLLTEPEDEALAEHAIDILEDLFSVKDLLFQHGHFQPGDLIKVSNSEVVLFSNLFWSYRIPYYDAVFGYHWMMLGMEHVQNLTPKILETERQKWFSQLFSLTSVSDSDTEKEKLNLALLERAVPALMVDRYMLNADPKNDKSNQEKIIVTAARHELKRLISICEQFIQ